MQAQSGSELKEADLVSKQYPRGSVVLAHFPFEERPDQRGPMKHVCIVVDSVERHGQTLFALCYGTSQLDEVLLASHSGGIMSVPNSFLKVQKGFAEALVNHYVLNRVALVPGEWIDERFEARFDFMREESRKNDQLRQRLFKMLVACEPAMQMGAMEAISHYEATGRPGLPEGKCIRNKSTR